MVEASRLSCVIVLPVDTACKHIRAFKFFQSPPLMTYREYATTSSAQYDSSRSSGACITCFSLAVHQDHSMDRAVL